VIDHCVGRLSPNRGYRFKYKLLHLYSLARLYYNHSVYIITNTTVDTAVAPNTAYPEAYAPFTDKTGRARVSSLRKLNRGA
jgi:hypothetical protein